MKIPRRIHQSWKDREVPEDVYPPHWVESWRAVHPNWGYTLWTDEDNLALVREHYPRYLDFYRELDAGIKRADFARFLYMHRFGGVYVDLDFIALRNLEPLLVGALIVVGTLSEDNFHYRIPNAFMASVPGQPFWLSVADEAMAAPEGERDVERLSGPLRLQPALARLRPQGLRVLDQHLVYPFDWIHFTHWDGGVHYRADSAELARQLRVMPHEAMASHFPDSYAVTTWNHHW